MKNPTHPTIPDTKVGSSVNSSKGNGEEKIEEKPPEPVFTLDQVKSLIQEQFKLMKLSPEKDDTRERMSDLIQKVAEAKAKGEEWVETTQENIDLLQPQGMGKDRSGKPIQYFCWQGIKICRIGKSQAIQEEESLSLHDRMHPTDHIQYISGAV